MPQMHVGVIYIIFWGDPVMHETSACPEPCQASFQAVSLLYSLVLDLAWLEALDETLAWNSQAKTFLLFQSCHPRASL